MQFRVMFEDEDRARIIDCTINSKRDFGYSQGMPVSPRLVEDYLVYFSVPLSRSIMSRGILEGAPYEHTKRSTTYNKSGWLGAPIIEPHRGAVRSSTQD